MSCLDQAAPCFPLYTAASPPPLPQLPPSWCLAQLRWSRQLLRLSIQPPDSYLTTGYGYRNHSLRYSICKARQDSYITPASTSHSSGHNYHAHAHTHTRSYTDESSLKLLSLRVELCAEHNRTPCMHGTVFYSQGKNGFLELSNVSNQWWTWLQHNEHTDIRYWK